MKRSRRGNRGSLVVWAQYLAFRTLVGLVRLLPLSAARALGRFLLGTLGYRVLRRARRRGAENAGQVLGLTAGQSEQLMRDLFRHLGELAAEFLLLPRLVRRGLDELIQFEDPGRLERLRDLPGGAVFVTGHLGSWEILGATTALMGLPLHSVARPLDNPLVGEFVFGERERFGQKIISKRNAWGELSRLLSEGKHLGFLADQDARRHGIFVEFFGRPASTTRAPALLALQHGAPIVPGCAIRSGGRYRILVAEPIWPDPDARDRGAEVLRLTQAYTRVLEDWIRAHPEQWMWLHRRWKTQPAEESEAPPAEAPPANAPDRHVSPPGG